MRKIHILLLTLTSSITAATVHVKNLSKHPIDIRIYTTLNREETRAKVARNSSADFDIQRGECIKDIWARTSAVSVQPAIKIALENPTVLKTREFRYQNAGEWRGSQGNAAGCLGDIYYYINADIVALAGQ